MIIEDDPYWYLQFPSAAKAEAEARNEQYTPNAMHTPAPTDQSSGFPFLDSLVPSYLSVDTEGRVVRLDTFSKTVGMSCHPLIYYYVLANVFNSTGMPSRLDHSPT
jgi:DNA-binding transcriptional MocR family regulator